MCLIQKDLQAGKTMYKLMEQLYPICRSITGNGTRKTLKIISEYIPLMIHEVATGTNVFDWTIPKEWNVKDAYVKAPNGKKIIEFKNSSLHVLNYSVPVHKTIPLNELKKHLFTLPKQPDVIPYKTSYYAKNWGFCINHNQFLKLENGNYEILIDSELKKGGLTYGEYYIKGKFEEEVLLSCYVCHPSLCNDSLSGVVLAVELAKYLSCLKQKLNYSFRFLFIPETIGAITWLAHNQQKIKKIKHGLVMTCVGDSGPLTYKKSKQGNSEIDQTVISVLKDSKENFNLIDFFPLGSDERQYCSVGFDLPVGSLMRTMYGKFPEYHTSADDLNFVKEEFLGDTFSKYLKVILKLEENYGKFTSKNNNKIIRKNKKLGKNDHVFLNLYPKCEPQLGRRGIYHKIAGQNQDLVKEEAIMWILSFSDGINSIQDIKRISKIDINVLMEASILLCEKNLIKEVTN